MALLAFHTHLLAMLRDTCSMDVKLGLALGPTAEHSIVDYLD